MTRKTLLGLITGLSIIGIVYLSVRLFRLQAGMPDNVIVSPFNATQYKGVDSVLIKATDNYIAGSYRKLILGKNYREAWDAPIKVPVLWLDTLHGGTKPVRAGGGGQTRSLVLEDGHGHKFALRSICKDAVHSMPSFGKILGLKNMVIDGISAGHPYASLPAAKLCEAAGIMHTEPRLVFLPEQAALDSFNLDFANRLYTLEYEQKGDNADWTGIKKVESTMESEEVMEQLLAYSPCKVDQTTLLTARLLDLMIDDWDRHPGNWGWVAQHKDNGVIYVPFPVDRDMAFYYAGGVAPWIFNRNGGMGKFRRYFRSKNHLKASFNKSRLLDPCFLNEMTRADFMQVASNLQQQLTDERIQSAFMVWPDTIYKLNAPAIIEKIKARRAELPAFAEAFYKHLAEAPQIMGTNGVDSFVVRQDDNRQLTIEMFALDSSGKYFSKYKRSFLKDETKEITLFGWDGADVLYVQNKLFIPLNFQGGDGIDRIISANADASKSKIIVFDDADGVVKSDNYKIKKKSIKAMMPRA